VSYLLPMRKVTRLMAGASVLLAASAPVAHAAEQVVRGRLFLVTGPSAGMSPSKRHVLIYGADFPGTTTVVGDPLANGAMLLVAANGRTSIVDGRGTRRQVSIVPPNPGTDGVMVLSINGGDSYCVPFGGAAGGKIIENDEETFRIAHPRFKECPEAP